MRKDNKEILLGYIATLPDNICREIYYYLTNSEFTNRDIRTILIGEVKLTEGQYNKLIWLWGKDKFDICVDILNEWVKKKGDKIPKYFSYYKQLIGWVEDKYYEKYPANDKTLKYSSKIDTMEKARKYVSQIPKELRANDSEVKFLLNRFGKDILL